MNDPNGPGVRVRRRRTRRHRRHRRNRLIRRSLLALVFLLGGLTGAALLPIDFGSFLASSFSSHPAPEWSNSSDVRRDLALSAAASDAPSKDDRPVYPYSIVPGGIHDPKELERVFERDPVVAAHYHGFDFRRARVVQLTEDRTVYVSYRIAGKVYWTTKKVRLHRGEKVITDGNMTLRTRCGNQVSENARKEVSPNEPAIAKMEQPIKVDPGTAMVIPTDFGSALTRPSMPEFVAGMPPYSLIMNNSGMLTLYPPPLPSCGPKKTKKGGAPVVTTGGKKGKGGDCSTPVGEVPEPGTLVLLSTGLAGAYLRYRNRARA